MPYLTVKIVNQGTNHIREDGILEPSIGHMWYVITDSNGQEDSYGFAPDKEHEGMPFAPGEVYKNDNYSYLLDENGDFFQTIYHSRAI